jgi:hypothetical protein
LLRLALSNNTVLLSWPAGAGVFVPESAVMLGNAANWSEAAALVGYTNGEFRAAFSISASTKFFRLRSN